VVESAPAKDLALEADAAQAAEEEKVEVAKTEEVVQAPAEAAQVSQPPAQVEESAKVEEPSATDAGSKAELAPVEQVAAGK